MPAERLFSDAGIQINPKRTCLAPKPINELLFLERNDPYLAPSSKDVWRPSANIMPNLYMKKNVNIHVVWRS
ncbi:18097_t:CDS:2 [Entrophospora sp. SA101]|nr:18097_t:CDS:2 [Entrophospora sp. SA101]